MVKSPPAIAYASVPRLWPKATVVVAASGPSLCAEDVEFCRGRAPLIAVKDAIRLMPDAPILYGCDAKFWRWHQGFPDFAGLKYSVDPQAAPSGVQILRNTGSTGLELDPSGLRTGHNSTYQAVNVAVHTGATRILLLGADMGHTPHQEKYFFGNRPKGQQQLRSPFGMFLDAFRTLVAPLRALGIVLINCSRVTALACFPRLSLAEALA